MSTSRKDVHFFQFVAFELGNHIYGFEIEQVLEIIRIQKITPIPGTVRDMAGVINLRGKIIPVIYLRNRFAMDPPPLDDRNRIVIVKYMDEKVGLIVDAVTKVTYSDYASVENPPAVLGDVESEYFHGFVKSNDQFVGMLNLSQIL